MVTSSDSVLKYIIEDMIYSFPISILQSESDQDRDKPATEDYDADDEDEPHGIENEAPEGPLQHLDVALIVQPGAAGTSGRQDGSEKAGGCRFRVEVDKGQLVRRAKDTLQKYKWETLKAVQ